MQTLKEDVRQRILDASRDEFYEKGYEAASIRDIAKASGVSLSNIYNYYSGKDTLLDAVAGETARRLLDLLRTSVSSHAVEVSEGTSFDAFSSRLTETLLGILSERRRETVILLEKSGGSRFSGTKEAITSALAAHFAAELDSTVKPPDGALFHVIASGFISGIVRLTDSSGNDAAAVESIRRFMKYHMAGIYGLLA